MRDTTRTSVTQDTLRSDPDAESSAQLDSLVRDVCGKAVVMLGEEPTMAAATPWR